MDYSFNVAQDFKVLVVFDILIVHFSQGFMDKNWIQDALKFRKKWKHTLPASTSALTKKTTLKYERDVLTAINKMVKPFSLIWLRLTIMKVLNKISPIQLHIISNK